MGARLLPEWRAARAKTQRGEVAWHLGANEGKKGWRGGQGSGYEALTCYAKELVGIGGSIKQGSDVIRFVLAWNHSSGCIEREPGGGEPI